MVYLKEILNEQDIDIKNNKLKRAFNYASEVICVGTYIRETIIILANLTEKIMFKNSVTDEKKAIEKLTSTKWQARVFRCIQYLHTHNSKYPDCRCTGVIRVFNLPHLPNEYLCSSINTEQQLSYSQTGADVNSSLFWGASFIFNGKLTSLLTEIVINKNEAWVSVLASLGVKKIIPVDPICLSNFFTDNCLPEKIQNTYTKQLLVPLNKYYISVTPIVSHMVQYEIHAICNKSTYYIWDRMYSNRSANIGSFFAATGGCLKVIKSIPTSLNTRWKSNINCNWLSKESVHILFELVNNRVLIETDRQKINRRKKQFSCIKQMIHRWLIYNKKYTHDDALLLAHSFHADLAKTNYGVKLAYHPLLLQPVELAFKSELKEHTWQGKNGFDKDIEGNFILLPAMRASHANAENCPYIVGLPSLTAFNGFAHNYCRKLSSILGKQVNHLGTVICIHRYSFNNRGSIQEGVYSTSKKRMVSPALVSTRQCDLEFTLILKINCDLQLIKQELLLSAVPAQFAGGVLHIPIDFQSYFKTYSSLLSAIDKIPIKCGKFLIDEIDQTGNKNDIKNVNDWLVFHSEHIKTNKNILLINKGYLLLEKPRSREGSTNGSFHCFVEFVIGTVKYVNLSGVVEPQQLLWQLNFSISKRWILMQTSLR